MSQQQRHCCEKQNVKPTGAENMLLPLCLQQYNKIQVLHLTSATKTWGGRNCCTNKSKKQASTLQWQWLCFFSQHTSHAVSVCVCVYVFALCRLFFSPLFHLSTPYFSLVSLIKGLKRLKDRIHLLFHIIICVVSCLETSWPKAFYSLKLILLLLFFTFIKIQTLWLETLNASVHTFGVHLCLHTKGMG